MYKRLICKVWECCLFPFSSLNKPIGRQKTPSLTLWKDLLFYLEDHPPYPHEKNEKWLGKVVPSHGDQKRQLLLQSHSAHKGCEVSHLFAQSRVPVHRSGVWLAAARRGLTLPLLCFWALSSVTLSPLESPQQGADQVSRVPNKRGHGGVLWWPWWWDGSSPTRGAACALPCYTEHLLHPCPVLNTAPVLTHFALSATPFFSILVLFLF